MYSRVPKVAKRLLTSIKKTRRTTYRERAANRLRCSNLVFVWYERNENRAVDEVSETSIDTYSQYRGQEVETRYVKRVLKAKKGTRRR